MPLTLTLSEGVLPEGQENVAFARLCEAMIEWHGLTGNKALTPNITGMVHVLPRNRVFSGMRPTPAVFIEWKVPSFAFVDRRAQVGYFEEATNIIHEMSGGKLAKDNIYINVVHAVDGAWNFGGQALTNAEMGEEITKG